ncbi:MAG: hypothetical protein KC503_45580 [Myxococcales bacterium]|nr:hypothetical protein [Myxococcales bacterium]
MKAIALMGLTLTVSLTDSSAWAEPAQKATVWNYFKARREYNRTRDRDERLTHREFFNYHFRQIVPIRLRPKQTLHKKITRLNEALHQLEQKAERSRNRPGNTHAFMETVHAFNELASQLDVAKTFADDRKVKPQPAELDQIRLRAVKAVGFQLKPATNATLRFGRAEEDKAFRGALANFWVLSNNK